jgi:hypothetical protein
MLGGGEIDPEKQCLAISKKYPVPWGRLDSANIDGAAMREQIQTG